MEVGDRVLVRHVGLEGKHKIEDRWEPGVYRVLSQPSTDMPVYVCSKEGLERKPVSYTETSCFPSVIWCWMYIEFDSMSKSLVVSDLPVGRLRTDSSVFI